MRNFLKFLTVVILTIFTCGCSDKSVVLFNKHPFTSETINDSVSNTNVFKSGERIYYLVTLPKPVETKLLLIQIYKIGGDKDERYGYDLVWGKRVKLRDEQKYYFTDYVVLNKEGAYVIKVYSRDNPTQILTTGNFYIKN